MAEYGYLKVEAGGSAIEGSCTDKGFDKQMVLYAYDQLSFFNYDDVQGRTTSNQHSQPVACVMKLDESAPELLKAFRKSAPCKVTMSLTAKDKSGAKATYFTVVLENARVVSWRIALPHAAKRDFQELPHSLEVAFSFEKVTVTAEKFDSTAKAHPKKMDTYTFVDPTG